MKTKMTKVLSLLVAIALIFGTMPMIFAADSTATYDLAKNLIATQVSATQVSVSWRNPANPVAQRLRLYDVSTGSDVLLKEDFDTTAAGLNEYLDATATTGATKLYRLDAIYTDGTIQSQTVGTVVGNSAGWVYDAGAWHFGTSASPKEPARMNVDDKVYKTAAPSIHVVSNKNGFGNGPWLELTLNGTVPAGTYRVSFFRKINGSEYIWSYALDGKTRIYTTSSATGGNYGAGKINACDWMECYADVTLTADSTNPPVLKMQIQGVCEDFWIDDVSVYKLENGTTTGDNLVAAIGSGSDVSAAPAAPTAVVAENFSADAKTALSWTVGTDAKYVAIYNKGSEDMPIAFVPASVSSVDIPSLTIGESYTYTVKTVNAEGRESATGKDVTVVLEEPTTEDTSMAKNLLATQVGANTVSVSWRNPVGPVAQQLKLYDVSNGKDVLLKDDFATTASGLNEYLDATVTSGATKVYRLDVVYEDGTIKSQIAGTVANATAGWGYDAAQWHFGTSAAPKEPARMSVDDKVYYNAAPSIHIISNKNGFGNGPWLTLTLNGTVPAGTYRVSFFRKINNSEYIWSYALDGVTRIYTTSSATGGNYGAGKINACDWMECYADVTLTADSTNPPVLKMQIQGVIEDFWIDDVSVYKLENGAITGNNLVAAIGAVSDVAAAPAAPTAATADTTVVNASAVLSWTVGSDAEYVAIYNKGSETIPVAYVPASAASVVIPNLTIGESYTYTVKTVNAEGRESATGMDVTLVPEEVIQDNYSLAKNLIVTQVSATQVSVSWRNPAEPVAQQIKLYDVSTGSDVLLKDDFATTASGLNEYLDATAVAGTNKVYRVDFIYDDGAVRSQTAGTTVASGGWVYDIGAWHYGTSAAPKEPTKINVDDKVYHTAAPSIHIASNKNGFGNGPVLTLTLDGTVPAGTYRVTFYSKVTNAEYIWTYAFGTNQTANRLYPTGTWGEGKINNTDWQKNEKDITLTADTTNPIITLQFQGVCEDFWIDDVSVYKLENSATTGDNLVAAIGDGSNVTAAPAAPTAAAADTAGIYNEATLNWTVGDDASYVAIYSKDNEDIPLAYVPTDFGYVDMKNLIAGREYTFTVKAVNAEGRESATGFDVTVTPNASPLVIGEFVTSKNGDNVTVSIDLKNNSAGANVTAQLIMATYYNDTMQTFKATDATAIPETAISVDPVTLSETIAVPEGYTMVMYLWDSLSGMKPLKESKTY